MMMRFLAAAALVALAGCGTSGVVRGAAVATSVASDRDGAWLVAVHQAGLMDVKVGLMAERKGGSAAVRRAGGMLVTGHRALDAKVTRLADSLGVGLPRSEGATRLAAIRRLDAETDGRFDTDFVATMAAGHQALIADTEDEIRAGSARAVRDLARAALPDLRHHLAMLRRANPAG